MIFVSKEKILIPVLKENLFKEAVSEKKFLEGNVCVKRDYFIRLAE